MTLSAPHLRVSVIFASEYLPSAVFSFWNFSTVAPLGPSGGLPRLRNSQRSDSARESLNAQLTTTGSAIHATEINDFFFFTLTSLSQPSLGTPQNLGTYCKLKTLSHLDYLEKGGWGLGNFTIFLFLSDRETHTLCITHLVTKKAITNISRLRKSVYIWRSIMCFV